MSSWKKASKMNQKTHRERHQPESRQHLGILEKKKDYKLRANNANKNERTLKLLRKRALNKNSDEFYHHMINSKIHDGEHHEKAEKESFSSEQLKLMRSQDIKYISMKRTVEARKIKRMQSSLHMIDEVNSIENQHIFFLDPEEANNFDLAKHLDTHPSLVDRRSNRIRLSDLEKMKIPDIDDKTVEIINENKQKAYNELAKRIEREKELSTVEDTMRIKRKLKEKRKLPPKLVQRGTKETAPVYKFRYERKK